MMLLLESLRKWDGERGGAIALVSPQEREMKRQRHEPGSHCPVA
ncbi:hypothetical protein RZV17_11405 [Xanthomonas cannabis]